MIQSQIATVNFSPPLIAILGAWILSVCIHEFSHALVAYWGGDTSVRQKGYLTLDPTRFIDPIFSLLIPAIILLMGGFPLPGGSVQVEPDRLRSRKWMRYISAAGPGSNFLLFLLLCIPIHPVTGWLEVGVNNQFSWGEFCAVMAFLNLLATFFNLIPVPPFDGFGMIEDQLPHETRRLMRQNAMPILFVVIMAFWWIDAVWVPLGWMMESTCDLIGMPFDHLIEGYRFIFS